MLEGGGSPLYKHFLSPLLERAGRSVAQQRKKEAYSNAYRLHYFFDVQVLPNGDVLNALEGSRKDLVGCDLKQCLIGTEGTFGIITKVALRCPPRPKSTELALLSKTML